MIEMHLFYIACRRRTRVEHLALSRNPSSRIRKKKKKRKRGDSVHPVVPTRVGPTPNFAPVGFEPVNAVPPFVTTSEGPPLFRLPFASTTTSGGVSGATASISISECCCLDFSPEVPLLVPLLSADSAALAAAAAFASAAAFGSRRLRAWPRRRPRASRASWGSPS